MENNFFIYSKKDQTIVLPRAFINGELSLSKTYTVAIKKVYWDVWCGEIITDVEVYEEPLHEWQYADLIKSEMVQVDQLTILRQNNERVFCGCKLYTINSKRVGFAYNREYVKE